LSERGRKQIRVLARFLKRAENFAAREVWHSPLVRSRDTATLLMQRLRANTRLVAVAGLAPSADPTLMAARLKKRRQPLVIVGHEPHLSALASLLVTGNATPPVFVLRKCAALALARDSGRWTVQWQVSPALLK
jgi:phosphohistidine phosphatase